MRILIVDDSPVSRLLLQRFLASYGDCELAKDGQEAIDAYRRGLRERVPFDLVCLDLGLPTIPGDEVLKTIRGLWHNNSPVNTRVIVTTASQEAIHVERIQRLGADGYLVKPIEKKKLINCLKSFGF